MSLVTLLTFVQLFILQKATNTADTGRLPLNILLIFTNSSVNEDYSQDAGIKLLKFEQRSQVTHSISRSLEHPKDFFCQELLKSSIYSLLIYSRHLGLTTAVASLDNNTFSNGLRFKKSAPEDYQIRYSYKSSQKRHKPPYITKPEHTETFKIASKRRKRDLEFPPQTEPPRNWDLFAIIKMTFFSKLLEAPVEETLETKLGEIDEHGLFALIKETLDNVIEDCEKGFLLVAIGGQLKEISSLHSDLVQSLHYIIENTEEEKTLIVLTGSCPDFNEGSQKDSQIPVYVHGGLKFAWLHLTEKLYDVPYAIKSFLEASNLGSI